MKKLLGLVLIACTFYLSACTKEEVSSYLASKELSDEEIADGLKTALKVGTDTAVSRLNVTDGYFKDLAVKVLLPEEMQQTITTLKSKSVLGVSGASLYDTFLKSKENDLILGINRAAEKVAGQATPLFVNAITNMTIMDAKDILFGEDTAATHYLRQNTFNGLVDVFSPEMKKALDEVKIGSKSVSSLWTDYVNTYNGLITNPLNVNNILGLEPYTETDLSAFATKKGLNGLFKKVADQEKQIRIDPLARVTDVLADVFGELDKKTN